MSNSREIRLSETTVTRPAGPWTSTIHALLKHYHEQGFTQCPLPISFDQDKEILTRVEGDTFDYPLSGAIASEQALRSAARLLRAMHDASSMFLKKTMDETAVWQSVARHPEEVICHGDFAPYNVALRGSEVIGVYDFDIAHPGPRIWDIAYAVYCWAPFKTHAFDAMGNLESQIDRAKTFCDEYGLCKARREQLVEAMIARLQALVDFMLAEAENGHPAFIKNIEEGHHLAYINDVAYLVANAREITAGVFGTVLDSKS